MSIKLQQVRLGSGIELSVSLAGSGPLVVLMHGWPELGLSWRHQMKPLADAGFTVAAPDMRGYGGSSAPREASAYSLDALADDMTGLADALGARRWISIGHDWGSPVAWRTALRAPERVVAVFALSNPHMPLPSKYSAASSLERAFPEHFYYVRYFQKAGVAEAELERDPRAALKKIFFSLSGDAPKYDWVKPRPRESALLDDLAEPPHGPLSFMSDAVLDEYAAQYERTGFFGSISWYRNLDLNAQQASQYGDQRIRQPAGFLCGDKEIVAALAPTGLEAQRAYCDDLRVERILPRAGHWIQQERPVETNVALLEFLDGVRGLL